MGTYAASLAIIQIGGEKPLFIFVNAGLRAKNIANAALDTLFVVPDRPLSTPATRLICARIPGGKHDTARIDLLPGFRPFLLLHGNTSIF